MDTPPQYQYSTKIMDTSIIILSFGEGRFIIFLATSLTLLDKLKAQVKPMAVMTIKDTQDAIKLIDQHYQS